MNRGGDTEGPRTSTTLLYLQHLQHLQYCTAPLDGVTALGGVIRGACTVRAWRFPTIRFTSCLFLLFYHLVPVLIPGGTVLLGGRGRRRR